MKAWVLEDIGNIKYKEVLKPQISENEVLVQVKAAGICGSDIPRIYQTGAHQMPLIPGHEFSGQVVQTGENADVKWQNKRKWAVRAIFVVKPPRKAYSLTSSAFLESGTPCPFLLFTPVFRGSLILAQLCRQNICIL